MYKLAIILMFSISSSYTLELDGRDAELLVRVEDNLGTDEVWSERSIIEVKSVKNGEAIIKHTRNWNKDLEENLLKIADSHGFYQLRFSQVGTKELCQSLTFLDTVGGCLPPWAGETFTLVVGGSQRLVSAHAACTSYPPAPQHTPTYNSSVVVRSPSPAIQPDTYSYVEKMKMVEDKEKENKDNRSFFAKYWMYIVPVVLVLLLSGGSEK